MAYLASSSDVRGVGLATIRRTSSSVVQSKEGQQPTDRTSTLRVLELRVEELGQMQELAVTTEQLPHTVWTSQILMYFH